MNLTTARLCLRRPEESDLSNMIRLESNPRVVQYTPMRTPRTPEQSAERLQGWLSREEKTEPFGAWIIERRTHQPGTPGEFIGWAMLMNNGPAELGYMIVEEHWGQGYATEAATALTSYGLDALELPAVHATVEKPNETSVRILERLGFKKMSTEENGELLHYAVTAEEFMPSIGEEE